MNTKLVKGELKNMKGETVFPNNRGIPMWQNQPSFFDLNI